MTGKPRNLAVSRLAMYAESPKDAIGPQKANKAALAYGTRAHAKVGKGPSLILYILIGLAVLWLLFTGKTPW